MEDRRHPVFPCVCRTLRPNPSSGSESNRLFCDRFATYNLKGLASSKQRANLSSKTRPAMTCAGLPRAPDANLVSRLNSRSFLVAVPHDVGPASALSASTFQENLFLGVNSPLTGKNTRRTKLCPPDWLRAPTAAGGRVERSGPRLEFNCLGRLAIILAFVFIQLPVGFRV